MCNHLNLKVLIHIFTIIYLIMIIIIMRGEKFVAHLDGLGGTPVAHHCTKAYQLCNLLFSLFLYSFLTSLSFFFYPSLFRLF
jgi:hypothetical protein